MILVDTSVWIDYFRNTKCKEVERLDSLLASRQPVSICGIVLTEVLAGISSESEAAQILDLFGRVITLPITDKDYLLGAELYRSARRSGMTVRRVVDCIIAACAISNSARLFHRDRDFDTLARISKLKLFSIN